VSDPQSEYRTRRPAPALAHLVDRYIGYRLTGFPAGLHRLQGVDGWDARFAVCDEVLGRLVTDEMVAPELRRSWDALVDSGGNVSIADLAHEVGWSRQHLARRFGDEFGLRPRLAGRVVRFERARRMLISTPSYVSVAQVAAACGYYDQSHLTHDFAELAGCSPTALLAEELPSFQDDDGEPGAP